MALTIQTPDHGTLTRHQSQPCLPSSSSSSPSSSTCSASASSFRCCRSTRSRSAPTRSRWACSARCFSLMQFLFSPVWGRWSDRIGRRPIILLGLIGSCVVVPGPGARRLAAADLRRPASSAALPARTFRPRRRTSRTSRRPRIARRGMGMVGAAFGLGFIFGPALGGMLSHFGPSAPMWFASALCLAQLRRGLVLPARVASRRMPTRQTLGRLRQRSAARLARPAPAAAAGALLHRHRRVLGLRSHVCALQRAAVRVHDARPSATCSRSSASILALVQGVLVGRVVKRVGEARLIPVAIAIIAHRHRPRAASRSSVPMLLVARRDAGPGDGLQRPGDVVDGVAVDATRRSGRHARPGAIACQPRTRRRPRVGRVPVRSLGDDLPVPQRGGDHVHRRRRGRGLARSA